MIIRVTRQDVEGAEHAEGRVWIAVDTPMYGRPRVWMGPESFQALRDVVGQDGEAWCEVPEEQVQREGRAVPPTAGQRPSGEAAPPELEDSEDAEDEDAEDLDEPGSLAGTVVLVDVCNDGERLLVIPVDVACSELRTYATLRHADTYREVQADDGAVETVVVALGRRLDERDEDDEDPDEGPSARELFDRRVADDASFSTDAVFGVGGWREWCPDQRAATERFVRGSAPRLWERFSEGGGEAELAEDYDPVNRLPIADQDKILARLQALGCEILPCPELDQQYWNPDGDLAARIDADEWPPRRLPHHEYLRPESLAADSATGGADRRPADTGRSTPLRPPRQADHGPTPPIGIARWNPRRTASPGPYYTNWSRPIQQLV